MTPRISGTWLLDPRTRRYVWAPRASGFRGAAVRARRCREKTAQGNVYRTREEAAAVAALCRQGGLDPVEPFLCRICGHFHVGKRAE